jgi:hypothetical protein
MQTQVYSDVIDLDVDRFIEDMRDTDVLEVTSVTGKTIRESMIGNIMEGADAHILYGFPDDKAAIPIAMFGCQNMGAYKGVPWMVATNHITAKIIMRTTSVFLPSWMAHYEYLYNWVKADNESSIEWLIHIGFKIYEPAPYGAKQELFRKFDWERPTCATPQ